MTCPMADLEIDVGDLERAAVTALGYLVVQAVAGYLRVRPTVGYLKVQAVARGSGITSCGRDLETATL